MTIPSAMPFWTNPSTGYTGLNSGRESFSLFTVIAIMNLLSGLFGLAAFSANIRFREIGVRKVWSQWTGIVRLLAKDFVKLVLLAIVIAIPIAWYAMDKWLLGFAYRINIGWSVLSFFRLIALFISFATISFQSVKQH